MEYSKEELISTIEHCFSVVENNFRKFNKKKLKYAEVYEVVCTGIGSYIFYIL